MEVVAVLLVVAVIVSEPVVGPGVDLSSVFERLPPRVLEVALPTTVVPGFALVGPPEWCLLDVFVVVRVPVPGSG